MGGPSGPMLSFQVAASPRSEKRRA
ncbi:DUF6053 domain-containing protein [Lysobacter yananisis]